MVSNVLLPGYLVFHTATFIFSTYFFISQPNCTITFSNNTITFSNNLMPQFEKLLKSLKTFKISNHLLNIDLNDSELDLQL